jgi:hypothetical protein
MVSQTLAARGSGVVVTVYSERRVQIAVNVATRLADAFARTDGIGRVGLAADTKPVAAPPSVAFRDLAPTPVAALPEVVRAARHLHDVTVFAPDEGRSQRAFLAMEHADHIVLPSDLTVVGIRSTLRVLQLLSSLGCPYDKPFVVLYDTARAASFSPADAILALKREVYFHVDATTPEQGYIGLAKKLLR